MSEVRAPGSRPAPWEPPIVVEEYRLLHVIGRGAMGLVYLGHDQVLERPVAVKFIATGEAESRVRQRFLIEARAVARLQHPNVVSIYRVGEADGHPFLVSELVRGKSVSRLPLPLPWERALHIGLGVARGLSAAHRQGVLHRDIKPSNIMITDEGEVKLLDFGVAKLMDQPEAAAPEAAPASMRTPALTGAGALVGTPLYMAPETLAGQPATARSDVYSLGVVLYELCVGRPPRLGGRETLSTLDLRVGESGAPAPSATPTAALRGVDARLRAIIGRCLEPDPALRFPSAEELRDALEALDPERAQPVPEGNPYRGLLPFEAEHRGLFFGRGPEIRAILERLREGSMVLVAGDSGVGKSSLCRAGVLPLAGDGLGGGRAFDVVTLLPGRRPLQGLAAALAPVLERPEEAVLDGLYEDPAGLVRELHRRHGRGNGGTLLFIDQLEELITIADPQEAEVTALALGGLAERAPHSRVLLSCRADFLTRLATLPRLGDALLRALYLLRPLSPEGVHEAIALPAQRKGVRFESPQLVEELASSVARTAGGLPLLQFALGLLWDARDRARGLIPASALQAIGGVEGALACHADGVLAAMPPAQRRAARRILVRLVNLDGTRARRGEDELGPVDEASRAALESLVLGRLLVARQAEGETSYEVAHEALVKGWATLREWLDADQDVRALRQRLGTAAAEWERVGRDPESLWRERYLAEAAVLDRAALPGRDAAFLDASLGRARRRRHLRRGILVGLPLLLGLGLGGLRLKARHDRDQAVEAHVSGAQAALREARARDARATSLRREALGHFDAGRRPEAERGWSAGLALDQQAEEGLGRAALALEAALMLDPRRAALRGLVGDVTYERLLLSERLHSGAQHAELQRRLAYYDDDRTRSARLQAPATLRLRPVPADAALELERFMEGGGQRRPARVELPAGATAGLRLAPGSFLVTARAPGRTPLRAPLLLGRGEALTVDLPLPGPLPPGMIAVPPGRFLFGSSDDEPLRRNFLNAPPQHTVDTGGYLIARNEVTFTDWIVFLRALPPEERRRRLPHTADIGGGHIQLVEDGGGFALTIQPTTRAYSAREGEPIRYDGRDRRAVQDWRRFPVSGVSFEDAQAYVAWLARDGRVPGARLCDEREWERAARGADGRIFPHGDTLAPDDANYDETYGRAPLGFGPDEVGSHPASASPFGVEDMLGNVWEWVRSVQAEGEPVIRGGSWYHDDLTGRSTNRNIGEPTLRFVLVGVRVCADYPTR